MNINKKREAGVTILESAILFVILSAFVMGVMAVVDYLQESRFVRNALERELSETAVKPFYYDGGLKINRDGIHEYLENAKDGIVEELAGLIRSGESHYVELSAAELEIDEKDGTVNGSPSVMFSVRSGNSVFIPSKLLQDTGFRKVVDNYIKKAKGKDGAFIYASPAAFRQIGGNNLSSRSSISLTSDKRYLPKVVLIYGRVFYGSNNSWVLNYLRDYSDFESVYHSTKVVTLRGDYDL